MWDTSPVQAGLHNCLGMGGAQQDIQHTQPHPRLCMTAHDMNMIPPRIWAMKTSCIELIAALGALLKMENTHSVSGIWACTKSLVLTPDAAHNQQCQESDVAVSIEEEAWQRLWHLLRACAVLT